MLKQESQQFYYEKIKQTFGPGKVNEQQDIISDEIEYKMDQFCKNGPTTNTIHNYIFNQYSKKSDFYYDFIQETDNTPL